MKKEIPIMISNRHVHLTESVAKVLFGDDGLTFDRYLFGDSGPLAYKEYVTIAGPKNKIERVRVLGPLRNYNQVELLRGDCYKLGIEAPVRLSGKLDGAATLRISGPNGEVELKDCGIIAHRHIHVNLADAVRLGLENGQIVSVRISGIRAAVLENVIVQVAPDGGTVMHVDTEEGNALMVANMDTVEILD